MALSVIEQTHEEKREAMLEPKACKIPNARLIWASWFVGTPEIWIFLPGFLITHTVCSFIRFSCKTKPEGLGVAGGGGGGGCPFAVAAGRAMSTFPLRNSTGGLSGGQYLCVRRAPGFVSKLTEAKLFYSVSLPATQENQHGTTICVGNMSCGISTSPVNLRVRVWKHSAAPSS